MIKIVERKKPIYDIVGRDIKIGSRIVYPIRVGIKPILRVMDVTSIVYRKNQILIRGTIGKDGRIINRWTKNSNQCAVIDSRSNFLI